MLRSVRAIRISKAGLLALAGLALNAPAAGANIYTQVLRSYESHGRVPPCQFSSQQLNSALKGIDTYGAQYFADFTTAVQSALQARATGVCSPAASRKHGSSGLGASSTPLRLGPITAATGADLPAPILMMAILAALVAMAALIASLVWWRGWSPAWAAAWQHMWSEAGFRAQGTWSEFSDWLRSG